MIIKTESGSEYYIRNGILNKANDRFLAYKVYGTKPFVHGMNEDQVLSQPDAKPEVGKRLYIYGLANWNITTTVVEIIDEGE